MSAYTRDIRELQEMMQSLAMMLGEQSEVVDNIGQKKATGVHMQSFMFPCITIMHI